MTRFTRLPAVITFALVAVVGCRSSTPPPDADRAVTVYVSTDLVARGDVQIGLTDTDDVNVVLEDGQPIGMVLPDKDGLGIPVTRNMISLIANAPHPDDARRLIFLPVAAFGAVVSMREAR